ncbi:MAG0110 family membrane protein [Mesomycoplasma ovipneumoniae]|uniref:MAG0110 family membrane protein n=1 Tax=Mesomycoplasma ovipneumoniae TaxID=29562 RepID=UPI002963DA6D|nr:Bax inhibitor-1 family protein [Mesomycoplasma ovipneumoniae]MDW2891289.1 Bax inhibitor-1 family protein [Mesomycoplasma ovipneumoniae]
MHNNIFFDRKDYRAYSRADEATKKLTNKLLSFSIMWLGIAILLVGLITFAILSIDSLFAIYLRMVAGITSRFAGLLLFFLLLIAVNFGLSYYINKWALADNPPTIVLVLLFFVFVMANSFLIPLIFTIQIALGQGNYIMIAVGGAGGIMALIGILGYFQVINFGKLLPLIMIGIFIELTLLIVSYFVFSSFVDILYSFVAITVTLGMIGYEFWIIRNQSSVILTHYNSETEIKRVFLRLGIANALGLYISFLRLVIQILRLLNRR